MSTIPSPGTTPRKRIQLFKFGINPTDRYGDMVFDHADAVMVMQNYNRRGRKLAIDVEHATQLPQGKPAEWQESHGWVGLEVDATGLHAVIDYNANGAEKVTARKFPYDSPAVVPWRGNHVRAVEMMSLVKDPARNHSIPLCMSNANAADTAEPTPKVKLLQRLHGAAGEFINALDAAKADPELAGVTSEAATALVAPVAKLNELLQQSGAAVAKEEKPAESVTTEPTKLMSGQPDALSVLGAEVIAKLGVKSPDEALGKLQALQDNTQTLMSAMKDAGNTDTKLLLLSGLQAGKIFPDEVEKYKGATPAFVQTLMSNRLPGVNVKQATPAAAETSKPGAPAETDHVAAKVNSMIERAAGVKL